MAKGEDDDDDDDARLNSLQPHNSSETERSVWFVANLIEGFPSIHSNQWSDPL